MRWPATTKPKVRYICIERKPEGHEVVTGTVECTPLDIPYECLRLYGGKIRWVTYSSAHPELQEKAHIADRSFHPVCAICMVDLFGPDYWKPRRVKR